MKRKKTLTNLTPFKNAVSFLDSCLHLLFLSNSIYFNHDCFLHLLCSLTSGAWKSPFSALCERAFLFSTNPRLFLGSSNSFHHISVTSVLLYWFHDVAFIILFLVWLLNWRTGLHLLRDAFFGTTLLTLDTRWLQSLPFSGR